MEDSQSQQRRIGVHRYHGLLERGLIPSKRAQNETERGAGDERQGGYADGEGAADRTRHAEEDLWGNGVSVCGRRRQGLSRARLFTKGIGRLCLYNSLREGTRTKRIASLVPIGKWSVADERRFRGQHWESAQRSHTAEVDPMTIARSILSSISVSRKGASLGLDPKHVLQYPGPTR